MRPPHLRLLIGLVLLAGSTATAMDTPEPRATVSQGRETVDPAEDPTAGLSRRDARIRGLELYANDDDLYTDLELEGAFIGEIRDRIEAGLEVDFQYTIELYKRRKWWLNKRLLHRRITTRVRRDNLAGRYILTREVEGEEVARTTTEDPQAVRRWMSRLERIPLLARSELPDEEDEATRLLLRAQAKIRDEFLLLFIPWDFETDWEKLVMLEKDVPKRKALEQGGIPGQGGTLEDSPDGSMTR